MNFTDKVRGSISFLLMALNTIFWGLPIFYPLALAKVVAPFKSWRKLIGRALTLIAETWISFNSLNLRIFSGVKWTVNLPPGMKKNDWYLVISNHQSWADILVLQKIFNRKIPFLKFFLKQELIWVPVLGIAWWALDFPFMKRYSKALLARKPELKGKDLETTKKACEKFKTIPVSVMNFVEGTRFTGRKKLDQKSPYQRLLQPKAAGMAYVLSALGDQMHKILNVTIVYPPEARTLWQLLCGEIREIKINIESMDIPPELIGDYFNDETFRASFQDWLNRLWAKKDLQMAAMSKSPNPGGPQAL